ncbi:hypothetical protein [Janthinobacterium fluminis]|uniref:Uncharacterized protein n=1 Tax=Janthinobacterium fluminis TaxID=2987524 RepID=A0ABT5JXC7_9BURK|nr:hypothetical protein [Janthinobacterium fluminis]MDC8757294.1 hypothetical protein [Janthinobacterium fluminis]
MGTYTDKIPQNKSPSTVHGATQKHGGGGSISQFVDERPAALAQRKLQELANSNSRVASLRAYQHMANDHAVRQRQAIQGKQGLVQRRPWEDAQNHGEKAWEDVKRSWLYFPGQKTINKLAEKNSVIESLSDSRVLEIENEIKIDAEIKKQPLKGAVEKGQGYRGMMEASVLALWANIPDTDRAKWDENFINDYFPYLVLDEPSSEFDIALYQMLRNECTVESVWNKHNIKIQELLPNIVSVDNLDEWKEGQPIPLPGAEYGEKEFKVGWKGSAVVNAVRRGDNESGLKGKQKFGEYTGHYDLGAGWLKAEGSYREGDSLQQNEIIYQIWRAAHNNENLDMNDASQRMPLRRIIRNHVVNKESRPILENLVDGQYAFDSPEYDILASTPNVRATLFLVKDRGKELGITGISKVEFKSPDVIIYFT